MQCHCLPQSFAPFPNSLTVNAALQSAAVEESAGVAQCQCDWHRTFPRRNARGASHTSPLAQNPHRPVALPLCGEAKASSAIAAAADVRHQPRAQHCALRAAVQRSGLALQHAYAAAVARVPRQPRAERAVDCRQTSPPQVGIGHRRAHRKWETGLQAFKAKGTVFVCCRCAADVRCRR